MDESGQPEEITVIGKNIAEQFFCQNAGLSLLKEMKVYADQPKFFHKDIQFISSLK